MRLCCLLHRAYFFIFLQSYVCVCVCAQHDSIMSCANFILHLPCGLTCCFGCRTRLSKVDAGETGAIFGDAGLVICKKKNIN